MESTGERNKIQCSQATADLLVAGGKKHWVHPRDDLVEVKGKGVLQTFFIIIRSTSEKASGDDGAAPSLLRKNNSVIKLKSKHRSLGSAPQSLRRIPPKSDHSHSARSTSRRMLLTSQHNSRIWSSVAELEIEDDYDGFEDANRQERLIEWNIEVLAGLLRRIVAHRQTKKTELSMSEDELTLKYTDGQNALDEITEIIRLGGATIQQELQSSANLEIDPDTIFLPIKVEEQLRVRQENERIVPNFVLF
jgi:hypothetical protein